MRKLVIKVFRKGEKEPIRRTEFEVDRYSNWVELWEIPGATDLTIRVEFVNPPPEAPQKPPGDL